MRKLIKLIKLFSFFLFATCLSAASANNPEPAPRPLAFIHVNVIPMTQNGVLKDQTVLVERGKITRLGAAASTRLPQNVLRINGQGKYLMPGLVDFHVHLRDPSELLSYLAHGVTTVVQMSGASANVADVLALRGKIAGGELLGPNIYTTGRILDGHPVIYPGVSTAVSTPEDAKRIVEEQYRAGVDFIKVYNNLTSEVLRAIVRAAHRRGLAVVGHIPRREGRAQALQIALSAGQDMIVHSEEFFFTYFYGDTDSLLSRNLQPQPDRLQIPAVVRLLRESGTAVTPNLAFVSMTERQLNDLNGVLSHPETRYLHPNVMAQWRAQNPTRRSDLASFTLRERAKYAFLQDLIPALQSGGVLLLLGTDSSAPGLFPGKSAHLELGELVKARLSPFQALATGTLNAGRFIKDHVRGAEKFGTITPGARADLLLLDGNPLTEIDNISRVVGVTVRGRWLSKAELDEMRSEASRLFNR